MLLFSVLLSSFYSPNSYAADLSYNMNDYDWITSVNLGTQYCAYSFNNFGSSPSICILTKNQPRMFGIKSYDLAHEKGDLAEFHVAIQNNIYSADQSFSAGSFGLYLDNFGSINDHFKIINFEQVDSESLDWANYTNTNYNCTVTYPDTSYSLMQCSSNAQNVNDVFRIYTKIYKVTILWTDRGSHPVVLNALNANTPIAKCFIEPNLVSTGAGQCQVRLFGYTQWGYVGSDTKKAIDNQTQQQQNQYNQEKQEESQREQSASGDSSQAQGLFNFNVLNPFANLWNAFNSSGCVSIPTIAGMLHSTNTTYCPWFPSSVRSTLTPVMAIASSMLLFGFVVRWLSGNSGDIYGARNMNKELNG